MKKLNHNLVLVLVILIADSQVSFGRLASTSNLVRAIFSFGDSILDAGNNHFNKNCTAQADFPPYGSSFFHHPTGRFTNGRTVSDFICKSFGRSLIFLLKLIKSKAVTFNNLFNINSCDK